jgi:transposase
MVGVIVRLKNGNLATLEKGKECIVNINNSKIYSERFTLGVATSNNEIIDYCVVKKGLKTDNYINFMDKMYNDLEDKENKTIFIDNASIHTSKKAKELYKKNNMHIIFNAPYHSEFNPIEYVFSMLRNEINRNPNDSIEKIKLTIDNFITKIKRDTLKNIFNNCINKIDKFLKEK